MTDSEATSHLNQVSKKLPNNSGQLRKRHWFLGSLVIVFGSWITHTTTATIAVDQYPKQPGAEVAPSVSTDPAFSSTSSAKNNKDGSSNFNEVSAVKHIVKKPQLVSKPHKIRKGESLGIIFKREKLDSAIPHHISQHPIAQQLTSIRVGKTIDFLFDETNSLKEIRYPTSSLEELVVEIDGVEVSNAVVKSIPYQTVEKAVSAEISSSLYLAAQNKGLSNNLIMEMVKIFGWDIDFVQDIRAGDSFHIVFTEHQKDGEKLSDGHILAAEFTTQGHSYSAIRFEDSNGDASYYNQDGESMLGTFLRSPVEFSRISSRFGKRKHPISKKWKAHKGVDYAASRGTPIRATADGKVTLAGRKGGYGKTVVLRHAGRFSTLYAHMNGFAKGIRSGVRVKQGQTIGYVGSTGMSTGPHLHYEFRVDGVHRNSLTYKTPKASSISKAERANFDKVALTLSKQLSSIKREYLIAKTAITETKKI
ncbi:peptidoglycan DD-metalloendopeptidase family protein [Arenicella sp. 4NH20-0111]|uniref:M23 family metallopeptidase n=1 Tax=Arenicella sp. 4NH20-0111 TaxID=3127648 RepID=UPI003109A0B1